VGISKHFLDDEAPHIPNGVAGLVEVPRHQGTGVGADAAAVLVESLLQGTFCFSDVL